MADQFGYSSVFYITALFLFFGGLIVTFGIHEDFTPVKHKAIPRIGLGSTWYSLLVLPGVLITYVMRFITSMGRMMTIPIIPLFLREVLNDSASVNTFTGLAIGIASGATMASTVILGKLSDRIGYRKILVISMTALAVGYAFQGYVSAGWQFLLLQALVGVALGGVIPIISAILANFIKAGDEGLAFGLDNSVTAAGRGTAPLLGAVIATSWGYPLTFVVTGMVFIISVTLAAWRLPASRSTPSDISVSM